MLQGATHYHLILGAEHGIESEGWAHCGKCTAMRKDPLSQRLPLTVTMCVGVDKELVEPVGNKIWIADLADK